MERRELDSKRLPEDGKANHDKKKALLVLLSILRPLCHLSYKALINYRFLDYRVELYVIGSPQRIVPGFYKCKLSFSHRTQRGKRKDYEEQKEEQNVVTKDKGHHGLIFLAIYGPDGQETSKEPMNETVPDEFVAAPPQYGGENLENDSP
jgi:hypothetical protein